MTERLYYTDPFLYDFEAKVLEVRDIGGRDAAILDRSAFYPTSGGQVFDTGTLSADGRDVRVVQVEEDADGSVLHFVSEPVGSGIAVKGSVDSARRRDHMQQHSGQHVLSAAFVRLFNLPTVSFHMGDESCTIDLNAKSLSLRQVEDAERLANEIVTDDRLVHILFHTAEEAQALGVRKLPAELREKLRLIDIEDFDLTACGGTHVRSTGQIGAILVRKTENVKQGVRVEFGGGGRAARTARRDFTTLTQAAAAYSTHIWELPEQIRKAQEETKAAARGQQRLLEELAAVHATRLLAETPVEGGRRVVVRAIHDRELAFVKLLAQKIAAGEGSVALLASTVAQPTLVFAQSPGQRSDMGELMKQVLAAVGGRGGGNKDFAQGGVPERDNAEAALQDALCRLRG